MKGADLVVRVLEEQGVDTVFGYPGGQILDVYEALYRSQDKIRHILSSHEQHACHAADGYYRATGKTGVVIATSGPGATNLVTGIATAYLDSVPIVAITGNVSTNLLGRDSFQECDITGITIPITKHNFIVQDVNKLADTLRLAFQIAKSGRPGPVLVDIPKNIQNCEVEYKWKAPLEKAPVPKIKQELIDEAVELLKDSKAPYIYIGGGALGAEVSDEIEQIADLLEAPIGTTLMGLGAIPSNNPHYLGMEGMHGHFASNTAQNEADVILTIGARFSDRSTGNPEKYARFAKIIQLDVDNAELNKNIPVDVAMAGDVADATRRILAGLHQQRRPEWKARIAELRRQEAGQFAQTVDLGRLNPYSIIHEVAKYATPTTPICTDVGQHQMWVAQYFPFQKPRTFVSSGGLGTMGFGLGAAIGAAMGSKQKSILFTGDGSFGMNLNELATLRSTQTPVAIFVFNNGVLGMVRQWQTLFYDGHYSNTDLESRQSDFVKIAEAFGIPAFRITNIEEMPQIVARAMAKDGPVLVDVLIDKDEFVLPMLPPGGSLDDIITTKEF